MSHQNCKNPVKTAWSDGVYDILREREESRHDGTSDKISDNSILAAGEERFRVLRNSDLYPSNYDYDTGKITNNFDGEGQITSAIRFIASDSLSKIYLVTGHGENELSEELEASLNKEGVSYENINLTVSEEIPEDASCVWLNVPVTDLTKQEAS